MISTTVIGIPEQWKVLQSSPTQLGDPATVLEMKVSNAEATSQSELPPGLVVSDSPELAMRYLHFIQA